MTVGHLSHQHQRFVPFLTIQNDLNFETIIGNNDDCGVTDILCNFDDLSSMIYNFAKESNL